MTLVHQEKNNSFWQTVQRAKDKSLFTVKPPTSVMVVAGILKKITSSSRNWNCCLCNCQYRSQTGSSFTKCNSIIRNINSFWRWCWINWYRCSITIYWNRYRFRTITKSLIHIKRSNLWK